MEVPSSLTQEDTVARVNAIIARLDVLSHLQDTVLRELTKQEQERRDELKKHHNDKKERVYIQQ